MPNNYLVMDSHNLTMHVEYIRVVIAMDPCTNWTNIDLDFAREMNLKIEETRLVAREMNL